MMKLGSVANRESKKGEIINSANNKAKPGTGSKKTRLNEEIRVPRIRLIDADGEQRGEVATRDAQREANEAGLDLVEVAPNANPPVCRIMDYGKYLFQQSKKNKAKRVQIKQINFTARTEGRDYEIKRDNLIKFLKQGHKIKVMLRFRGREVEHADLGMALMQQLQHDLEPYGTVEQAPKRERRQIIMLMAPGATKDKATS